MGQHNRRALIVGGSSGLGLELAQLLTSSYNVTVTGRRNPENKNLDFCGFDLSDTKNLTKSIDRLLEEVGRVDLCVYAAGFYQEGTISDLSDEEILAMVNVGLLAPIFLLQRLLKKQKSLKDFIAVTSTSQWTPRLLEPVYTATKAGLGMLANSLSCDARVGKVLVAAPAGMNTRFWENHPRDNDTVLLDPFWVAKQIIEQHYTEKFKYRFVRILRGPARVEVVESR
jgi:NAD(P)-dependent dehydrogenase (short-subunit alcohol dehydrogenase family)